MDANAHDARAAPPGSSCSRWGGTGGGAGVVAGIGAGVGAGAGAGVGAGVDAADGAGEAVALEQSDGAMMSSKGVSVESAGYVNSVYELH